MSHHGDAFRKKVNVIWHWVVNSGFSPALPFVLKTAKGRLTDLDCLRTRVQSSSDLVFLPSHHPRSERLAEEGIDTYNPGDLSALGSYSIRHGWRAYSVFPSWPALCGPSTVEVSSGLWLCGFEGVSGDGAGDDQDFSHDGGQGDFSGAMIGFDEAIVEVLHRGRIANGGPGGVEQGAAHERSSVAGFGLPAFFSAFVRMGGESDEGCDLFSGPAAELRQVGDQRRGHDGTHAAHPAQSLGEAIKALGQRRDDGRETLPDDRLSRPNGG